MIKKKKIRWKQYLPIYLLALPGIIYMICNNYLPMFGIVIAFKKTEFCQRYPRQSMVRSEKLRISF